MQWGYRYERDAATRELFYGDEDPAEIGPDTPEVQVDGLKPWRQERFRKGHRRIEPYGSHVQWRDHDGDL